MDAQTTSSPETKPEPRKFNLLLGGVVVLAIAAFVWNERKNRMA